MLARHQRKPAVAVVVERPGLQPDAHRQVPPSQAPGTLFGDDCHHVHAQPDPPPLAPVLEEGPVGGPQDIRVEVSDGPLLGVSTRNRSMKVAFWVLGFSAGSIDTNQTRMPPGSSSAAFAWAYCGSPPR